MRLHLDQNAFRVLINTIHEKTGYRTDVLEKDYYVLREQDRIEFAAAALALDRISEQLSANEAWQKCKMPLVSLDDRAPATYSESKTGHEKRGMSKSRKRNPER